MERVSFKVAKALKGAGYPQEGCDEYFNKEGAIDFYLEFNMARPTCMEVWLWLWREKKIHIENHDDQYKIYDATEWIDNFGYHLIESSDNLFNDPEEAIIAAIDYLVENDLIK